MMLEPEQLHASLQRKLYPIYLLLAEEPLQALEAGDAIRAAARQAGFGSRTVLDLAANGDWSEFSSAIRDRSLFAERVVIELRLPTGKPGVGGGAKLAAYGERPAEDLLLMLHLPRPDSSMRQAAWFQSLQREGAVVHARPIPPQALGAWIRRRMQGAGMTITEDALALLVANVEGNLLAARQEIDKLQLMGATQVNLAIVQEAVATVARYDLGEFAAMVLAGKAARALQMLQGMLAEGQAEPLILWLLSRDLRALLQASERLAQGDPASRALQGFWGTDTRALGLAVRRIQPHQAQTLLARAATVDRIIKGRQPGNAQRALLDLTIAIAGAPASIS